MNYIQAEVHWPFLRRKQNEKFAMELTNLSEQAVDTLKEEGVTLSDSDTKGTWLAVKSNYPPRVFDTAGNELPDEVVEKIGNGSVISMAVTTYSTSYNKKKFTRVNLQGFTLVKMKEFIPDGGGSVGEYEGEGFVYDGGSDAPKDDVLDDDIPF